MITRPRRVIALAWLLLIPVGGVAGRIMFPSGSMSPPSPTPVIPTEVLAGSVIGAFAAFVMLAVSWRTATRRRRVFDLHPEGVIIEAEDIPATADALARIRDGVAPVGHAYTVVFARDGVHIYQGHELSRLAVIAWDDVAAVHDDVLRVASAQRAALVVELSSREAVPIPLALVVDSRFRSPVTEAERAATAAEGLRAASTAPSPDAHLTAPVGRATPVRRELVRGIPSTRLRSWTRFTPYLGIAGIVVVILLRLLSGAPLSREVMLPAAICLFAASVLTLALVLLAKRAAWREGAAGYTLDRLGDTALDQVDASSGYVIRAAGEGRLTAEQQRAALERIASMR
jgi:hypothetical protein